jgi:hypothetical protein
LALRATELGLKRSRFNIHQHPALKKNIVKRLDISSAGCLTTGGAVGRIENDPRHAARGLIAPVLCAKKISSDDFEIIKLETEIKANSILVFG